MNAPAPAVGAPAPQTLPVDHVFYDGECGFCHWSVRFLAARDGKGRFRYAPLGGATFLELVPEEQRAALPDSLVVHTADGRVLVESPALLHCPRRLGGGLAFLARSPSQAYSVAGSFLRFLSEERGVSLANLYRSGDIASTAGAGWPELERAWRAHIASIPLDP
ncbi:MAG: DUF393 domain-containing protein, partial [Myxococcota bacterium]